MLDSNMFCTSSRHNNSSEIPPNATAQIKQSHMLEMHLLLSLSDAKLDKNKVNMNM